MESHSVEVLFVPYYYDVHRWHNDQNEDAEQNKPSLSHSRGKTSKTRKERMAREGTVIDGKLLDFSRFLSWIRYGTTTEFERFDSYSITLLSGSYYQSFLSRHGIDIRVANAVNRYSLELLAQQYEPKFVLLSTTLILEHIVIKEAVSLLRRIWPDTTIVLGGLFLVEMQKTLSPEDFRQLLLIYNADVYIVSPYGESSMLEVIRRDSKEPLQSGSSIPCTYIVSNGSVIAPTTTTEHPLPMEDNPILWSQHVSRDHLYNTVNIRTARSCPFKCAFCNFPINQGPLTLMPLETVKTELKELTRCKAVRSLVFVDDTFNVPTKRFQNLCASLMKFDYPWYSNFRPQFATDEIVALMKQSQCQGVFLGIESADDGVLKNMNKASTVEAMKKGIQKLKNAGITLHASFIVGFPGETEETARKIMPFLDDTEIDFFSIVPWSYVPSTPIHERKEELGLEGSFENWKHDTMTSQEAHELVEELRQAAKYSVHVPELAANIFYSEIMLLTNGFTVDEAKQALRTFNLFSGRDVSAEEIKKSPEYAGLLSALHKHEFPVPKNY